MTLLIFGGEVLLDGQLRKANLLCKGGKIARIGEEKFPAERAIDASGKIVLPGMIDCHVHAREPGDTHKEDFLTASMAAAAGGITTFLAMPNTRPPILTPADLENERELAKKAVVNWGCYACGADNAEEIRKMTNIPGVKIYLDVTTGNMKVDSPVLLEKLFASRKRVAVHAEGKHVAESISRIKGTENSLYLCHISTRQELGVIRKHKDGRIFCEVTPHHLFLTKEDAARLGPLGSMKPSLKGTEDVEELWEGIRDRTVDTIGTDHAPHTLEEKKGEHPPWGVPGMQTMLPLLLNAVNEGRLTLPRLAELCASNPARIFGIRGKGSIEEGKDADLVIVDMQMEKEVRDEEQLSRCGWTPFHGKVLKGWPVLTLVNGNIVFDGRRVETAVKGREVEFE